MNSLNNEAASVTDLVPHIRAKQDVEDVRRILAGLAEGATPVEEFFHRVVVSVQEEQGGDDA